MSALLQDLLVVFGLGIALVMLFHRFNLPSVLGFLVTGVITGPFGLKLVDDVHAIEILAEIGLVLLLFEAGIEFSVKADAGALGNDAISVNNGVLNMAMSMDSGTRQNY